MSQATSRTFTADFRRFFVRGLVVLLPSVLTLWIMVKAYQFIDTAIANPINRGIRTGMVQATDFWTPLQTWFDPSEEQWQEAMRVENAKRRVPVIASQLEAEFGTATLSRLRSESISAWWAARWYMELIGLVVAVIAVYIAGRLLGGFVGRRIYKQLESLLVSVPVFKQVYPHVKQVVDFLFGGEKPIKFGRVVVLEYPRKGIWSIGFLTGSTLKDVARQSGESVTVFIPSSPTPFTGYTITVPREEVIEVAITVDEALRFTVSGGVLVPDHQAMSEAEASPESDRTSLIPIPSPPITDADARTRVNPAEQNDDGEEHPDRTELNPPRRDVG
jgi:uncharacterized membrane protein